MAAVVPELAKQLEVLRTAASKDTAAAFNRLNALRAAAAAGDDQALLRQATRVCATVARAFRRIARARALVDTGPAPAAAIWTVWRPFATVELQLHDIAVSTWRILAWPIAATTEDRRR
jgi:hypothetical protein